MRPARENCFPRKIAVVCLPRTRSRPFTDCQETNVAIGLLAGVLARRENAANPASNTANKFAG